MADHLEVVPLCLMCGGAPATEAHHPLCEPCWQEAAAEAAQALDEIEP